MIVKTSSPSHLKPFQTNHPNPELNPRCFVMYVILCQTFFWSGQRRTDFEKNQTL